MIRMTHFPRISARLALIATLAALIGACGATVDTNKTSLSQVPASSAPILHSLGSVSEFSVLGGTNVTCTAGSIGGDVGVSPGSAVPFTNTGCVIPGATPPAIRLAQGYVSSLVFVDSTGAPWPIASFDIGDPKGCQWVCD